MPTNNTSTIKAVPVKELLSDLFAVDFHCEVEKDMVPVAKELPLTKNLALGFTIMPPDDSTDTSFATTIIIVAESPKGACQYCKSSSRGSAYEHHLELSADGSILKVTGKTVRQKTNDSQAAN